MRHIRIGSLYKFEFLFGETHSLVISLAFILRSAVFLNAHKTHFHYVYFNIVLFNEINLVDRFMADTEWTPCVSRSHCWYMRNYRHTRDTCFVVSDNCRINHNIMAGRLQ